MKARTYVDECWYDCFYRSDCTGSAHIHWELYYGDGLRRGYIKSIDRCDGVSCKQRQRSSRKRRLSAKLAKQVRRFLAEDAHAQVPFRPRDRKDWAWNPAMPED